MLFASASFAKRIERAESTLIAEAGAASARRLAPKESVVRHVAGGVAVWAEPGSPLNKVAGLGFAEVPGEGAFDELERELAARCAPVQVELSTLGDPGVARMLTRRGYELVGFENVLGMAIDLPSIETGALRAESPVTISPVSSPEHGVWLEAVLTGFENPDSYDGPASHESFERDVLANVYADMASASGFRRFLARLDGRVAGGASLRLHEGVAQLCGAATVPAYRRRGVQTALLRHRLLEAARRGCDVAVVTTMPGSRSQQNVQRAGFELLYARAILVKSPPA